MISKQFLEFPNSFGKLVIYHNMCANSINFLPLKPYIILMQQKPEPFYMMGRILKVFQCWDHVFFNKLVAF